MAFLWLTWKECVAAWASVYYLPLLYMVTVLLLGNLFPVKARKQKVDGDKKADTSGGAAANAGTKAHAGGEEVVDGDLLHLGEGIKSAMVDGAASKPGSARDLTNGVKED
jgi:hypothetical protein